MELLAEMQASQKYFSQKILISQNMHNNAKPGHYFFSVFIICVVR